MLLFGVLSLVPVIWHTMYTLVLADWENIFLKALIASVVAYLPTYPITLYLCKRDGFVWPWFQRLSIWHGLREYFSATIQLEEELDHKQGYIFCCFPHGACSVNHILTMTDCCGMLSKVHPAPRRDLAASILFYIPLLKELMLFLGCVDARAATAHLNMRKGRSLLIFIGGEKEQLMTQPGSHKIYLKDRKGFVKLAIQYGFHLVPMYVYGENEAYSVSNILLGFRQWLQQQFQIGICICWGRFGSPIPYKVPLTVEIGKPVPVQQKARDDISDDDVSAVHTQFVAAMDTLFERTKSKHGVYPADTRLQIC